MTDEKLYQLCKHFGAQALEARRKFLGLLPEVNRREIASRRAGRSWLARRGFTSIFEFAAKLAGASKEQVRRVLQLEQKFENLPVLKNALISGSVSVNKLARIASIATNDNQEILLQKTKLLPKSALETLVKDIKTEAYQGRKTPDPAANPNGGADFIVTANGGSILPAAANGGTNSTATTNGLQKALFADDSVPGHRVQLADQTQEKLWQLQQKGIDIDKLIQELLEKRELEIAREKEKLAEQEIAREKERSANQGVVHKKADLATLHTSRKMDSNHPPKHHAYHAKNSRYISVKIKRVLSAEYGAKCAMPSCGRKAEVIHHTARFSLTKIHDPRYLAPLCKNHHLIAHSLDQKFWQKRAEKK